MRTACWKVFYEFMSTFIISTERCSILHPTRRSIQFVRPLIAPRCYIRLWRVISPECGLLTCNMSSGRSSWNDSGWGTLLPPVPFTILHEWVTFDISLHTLLTFDRSKDAKRDIVEVDAFHQEGVERIQNVQGCLAPPFQRHPQHAVQERGGKNKTQIKMNMLWRSNCSQARPIKYKYWRVQASREPLPRSGIMFMGGMFRASRAVATKRTWCWQPRHNILQGGFHMKDAFSFQFSWCKILVIITFLPNTLI